MNCLFIGGSADGQWREVQPERLTWQVPIWSDTVSANHAEAVVTHIPIDTYLPIWFASGTVRVLVWHHASINKEDVLQHLLHGYHAK